MPGGLKALFPVNKAYLVDLIHTAAARNPLVRMLYKLWVQARYRRGFPIRVRIDPSRACNLSCYMCAVRNSKKPAGMMEYGLFKKIVDECAGHGSISFNMCKDGEPLLNPGFAEMIKYIKAKDGNNEIIVITNGQLLTEEISRGLLDAGIERLTVSIRAASEVYYRRISGKEGLAAVEENVRRFLELKSRLGKTKPVVYLQFIDFPDGAGERRAFTDKWKGYDVKIELSAPFTWAGAYKQFMPSEGKQAGRYPCGRLWSVLTVNWNGEVSVCCFDHNMEHVVGDLRRQSIKDIWRGEELMRYRWAHLDGDYSAVKLCAECEKWSDLPDIFFSWQKRKG